jgi:hypothetical protein
MSDNISLKKLLLPNGVKSEQYLKSGLNVHPYVQLNKNIVSNAPSWLLMGAQFYDDEKIVKKMKNNDVHNEFTDFVVDVARYQGNHIHNNFNEKIYNDIYLNWNNLNEETRNFYDTFLGLYQKDNQDYQKVNSYNSLPTDPVNGEYKMKFNMSGGSTLFGKLLPSLPNQTEDLWYTNSEGNVVSQSKQSTNDLKSIYTCLFMNADTNICKKYALKIPEIAGGSNEGFSININAAAQSYLDKAHMNNTDMEGGNSVLDNELIFNNYFLKSVLNEDDNNVSNCVNLLRNYNLDSTGKVDMDIANESLSKLGFSKKDDAFESVSSWKNKSEDVIKNRELIDLMNSDSNISVLSHLNKIVNYVNYKNKMGQEPIILESSSGKSIEDLGLQTDWIPDFLEKTNNEALETLDVNKLYEDISTKGYTNQTGGAFYVPGTPFIKPPPNRLKALTPKLLPPFVGPVGPGLLPHPYIGGPIPLMPGVGPVMTTFPGSQRPRAPRGLWSWWNPFSWWNGNFTDINIKGVQNLSNQEINIHGDRGITTYLNEIDTNSGSNLNINFKNFIDTQQKQCNKNNDTTCIRSILEVLAGLAHITYVLNDGSKLDNINKAAIKKGLRNYSSNTPGVSWGKLIKLKNELIKNIDTIITNIKNTTTVSTTNINNIYGDGKWQ